MTTRLLALALLLLDQSTTATDRIRDVDTTLAAFIGDWELALSAEAASFGDRAGAGTGRLTCRWGAQNAWIDCDLDSVYDGLGSYGLKMILFKVREPGVIGAFVTNSFGGGRMYSGTWRDARTLVFEDAWIDPANNWQHQRTTYTFDGNGAMRFFIEVSRDGTDFVPHSGGVYRRAQSMIDGDESW